MRAPPSYIATFLLTIFFIGADFSTAIAQVDFIKKFTFNDYDDAWRVIETNDSEFAVAGVALDTLFSQQAKIVLLKISTVGDSMWSKQFGPFNNPTVFGLAQFNTGDFVIGYNTPTGCYFLRTTDNGDSLLNQTTDSLCGREMRISESQSLFAVNTGGDSVRFRRYNQNLVPLWQRSIKFNYYPVINCQGVDLFLKNEELYAAGSGFTGTTYVPLIEQSDSDGNYQWFLPESQIASELLYGGIESILETESGNLIMSLGPPAFGLKSSIVEFDSIHEVIWQTKLQHIPLLIAQKMNKNIIISTRDVNGSPFIELDQSGDSISYTNYDTTFLGGLNDLLKCSDGSLIAVGTTSYITSHRQFYVIKLKAVSVGIEQLTSSQQISLSILPIPLLNSGTISFSLQEHSFISMELLDLSGRKIKTLLDENLEEGDHIVQLNREQLTAGIYFLRVKMDGASSVWKIIVL